VQNDCVPTTTATVRQFICSEYGVGALIQCQAVTALAGQTVFHGRIYKTVHSVDFRLEFIVSGSDITLVSALHCVYLQLYDLVFSL